METARDFLVFHLGKMVRMIPELKILYRHDAATKQHLAIVLPREEYDCNREFHAYEENLLLAFSGIYAGESLEIDSDESRLTRPEKVFEGEDYFDY